MRPLKMLAILAIANIKDRSTVDPANHFGHSDNVKQCIDAPKEALRDLIKLTTGRDWNMTDPLWQFLIEQDAEECRLDKQIAEWGVDNRRRSDAVRMVEHERIVPGSVTPRRLKEAQDLMLLPAVEKPQTIEFIPPENL